jgi:TadE-like protein
LKLARQLRSTEASEIAEAALVLPVVFLFLLGIIWFGRAFNIYATIQQAAQQGAITAARPTCATCGSAFPGNGGLGACPSASPTVVCAVANVLQASNIDPSQIIAVATPSGCTTVDKITICQNVLLNSSSVTSVQACGPPTPSQICGTLVAFQYPFRFNLPILSLKVSTITLTAQAQSRTEN